MSAQTSIGVETPGSPETMPGLSQLHNQKSPQQEDSFVSCGDLYMPVSGDFRPDRQKAIPNGTLITGAYITERAMHPTRIYLPDGYTPSENNPVVARTSALGTGVKGFNDIVSREIMDAGAVVISKGPPRYYGPTLHALTQTQDANEIHGLVSAVERSGIIRSAEQIWVDGQSQSAMKALGVIAIAPSYSREVVNGHIVAACFLDRANVRNPRKFIRYGTSMLESMVRAGIHMGKEVVATKSVEPFQELGGTVDIRDMHHHVIVLPVLMSGEAGSFLPFISAKQKAFVDFFGRDRSSRAHRAHSKISAQFPNMDISLDENYGHVDGINSPETRARRQQLFTGAVQSRDARPVLKVLD